MLARFITDRLVKSLGQSATVALLGPRQVGKTTLAKSVAQTWSSSLYLDLESPEDLLKLSDPAGYLGQHGDKLVIIDEIQRSPELFMVLRGLIDGNRERGRAAGHFLLLGSASMDLLRQSSESLAGRIRKAGRDSRLKTCSRFYPAALKPIITELPPARKSIW